MLLTITTTHHPATDLGYLLAKNPAKCQSFELAFGQAHVFYPVAREDLCTAALLLDLDPIGLVRGSRRWSETSPLGQYVNDRPYVASSFLSVAIARIFATAAKGSNKDCAELAAIAIPLVAEIAVLPCRGGETLLRQLFEPLGYAVETWPLELDAEFPEWGASRYFRVRLTATCRLRDLLTHLYVLLPVLDNDKHYWVGQDELDKLLARGEGWLATHPERDQIVHRYLKNQRGLTREALARLVVEDEVGLDAADAARAQEEAMLEKRVSLNEQRLQSVFEVLRETGARRVVDLGCGEGRLLQLLLADPVFEKVVGMDVSHRALDVAQERLHVERMAPRQRERLELFQGSLTYRDQRLAGYDAAAVVEVLEHLEPSRLAAFERVVFEFARPQTVVLTTPNAEYNVRFESLPAGKFRHRDHRFEWTREEFETWASGVSLRHGYAVRFVPVGPVDDEVGSPTQMAVFSR